jgi:hypothetical protein
MVSWLGIPKVAGHFVWVSNGFKYVGAICNSHQKENIISVAFPKLFARKDGKKRKLRAYRSYVVNK